VNWAISRAVGVSMSRAPAVQPVNRRIACDAMIVPIVTATLDTSPLGDLIQAGRSRSNPTAP
jgi:hypothetical protein